MPKPYKQTANEMALADECRRANRRLGEFRKSFSLVVDAAKKSADPVDLLRMIEDFQRHINEER